MEFYTFAKKNYNKRAERMNTYEQRQRMERRNQLPFDYEQEQERFYYEQEPKDFYFEHEPKNFYYEQEYKNLYKKRPFNCEEEQDEELYENEPYYYEYEPTTFIKRQPFEMEEEQRVPRKWYNVMYTKETRPEAITIVVDPIYHTITVNGKRVIPLPKNVNVEELRVKVTPRGELLFKAPCYERFVDTTELQRYGKFAIPVIFSQKVRAQKYQQREQRQRQYFQRFFVPQYYHVLKSTTNVPKFVESRCERDETTGKFMVIFEVNTVGFRREDIQVRFLEEKHLLLVKAMHQIQRQETELKGIAPKTLLREFILPEWLEGSEMRYHLLKNGLLRIEVPCTRDHCPMTKERRQIKQQQLFQGYNFYKTY